MAYRNISVALTANVSQYSTAINKAAAATQKLNQAAGQIRITGKQMANQMQTVGAAARETNAQLHQMRRGGGIAAAGITHTSAAAHMGARGLRAFGLAAQEGTGFIKTFGIFLRQSVATIASFSLIHNVISVTRRVFNSAKDAIVDFDEAMTKSTAIIPGLSQAMRKDMTEAALAMSRQWGISSKEAAGSLFFLASAGYNAQQSIKALPIVSAFARAGLMELDKAAELLVDTQKALKLGGDDTASSMKGMTQIANVLTAANIASNATVEQLAQSLQNKAASAGTQAGQSFEEITAVLMAFASQGVKSKVAGDRYNQVLRDMQTQAIKNRSAFEAMGISVYNTDGNMRPLADIIVQLEERMDGMSTEQKRATFMMLGFQDRSVAATIQLLNTGRAMQRYTKDLEVAKKANLENGRAMEVATKNMQSIRFQWQRFRENVLAAAIEGFAAMRRFGGELAQKLGPTVANLGKLFRDLASNLLPLIKIGVGIAGLTIWKVFQGAIWVFERLAGFAAKFSTQLSALAVVLGTRYLLAVTAASVQTGLLSTALYRLTFNARLLAAAMQYMAVASFRTVASAAGAASAAFTAAGGGLAGLKAIALAAGAGLKGLAGSLMAATTAAGLLGAAVVGVTAGLAIIAMGWMKATQAGKAYVEKTKEGLDLTTRAGRTAWSGRLVDSIEEATANVEKYEKRTIKIGRLKLGPPWDMFAHMKADRQLNEATKAREELAKKELRATEWMEKAWKKTGKAMKGSDIKALAESMGIALSDIQKTSDPAFVQLTGRIKELAEGVVHATGDIKNMTKIVPEEAERMREAMEEARKGMDSFFSGLIEPSKIFQDEMQKAQDALKGFTNASEVYKTLEDAAKESVQNQAEARKKAIDDELNELEESARDRKQAAQDEARDVTRSEQDMNARRRKGSKARKGMSRNAQDEAREETRAIEDNLRERRRALEAEKKKIDDDVKNAVPKISFGSYVDSLRKAAEETETYRENMRLLREKGLGHLAQGLQDMGKDGIPMLNEVAKRIRDGGGQIATDIQEANRHIGTLGDVPEEEIQLSLEDLTKKIQGQVTKQRDMIGDLLNISMNLWQKAAKDPDLMKRFVEMGIHGPEQLAQALTKLGPEAGMAIRQMAQEVVKEGSTTVENFLLSLAEAQMTASERVSEFFVEATNIGIAIAEGQTARYVQGLLEQLGPLKKAAIERYLGYAGVEVPKERGMYSAWFGGNAWGKQAPPEENKTGGRTQRSGWGRGFAEGGVEDHTAQMAKGGEWRVWAEPETGGEAYIPLGQSKRARSVALLSEVADRFGFRLSPYAFGGVTPGQQISGVRPTAGQVQPQVVYVNPSSPQSQVHRYEFSGDIVGVKMEDAVEFADRKRRQRALVNR